MVVVSKKIVFVIVAVVLILGGVSAFYFFNQNQDNFSLTRSESKWIDDNQNKLIDLSILTDVPIINDNGSGMLFDFLNDLEDDTNLVFNRLSYSDDDAEVSDYALRKKDAEKNDLVLYNDSYALLSKDDTYYLDENEINNVNIGVLSGSEDKIKKALDNESITLTTFDDVDALILALDNKSVNFIALPKLTYFAEIVEKDLNIAYNINNCIDSYVITLGDNKALNNILTKYFKYWIRNDFNNSLNSHLASSYFDYKDIDEKSQTKFRSKRYTYGFILNAPYEASTKNGIQGFNYSLINNFEKMANVEVDFKRYSSLDKMIEDFNNNKIDFIADNDIKYSIKVTNTPAVYDGTFDIIADENTSLTVASVESLKNVTVSTVKNSKIDNYLKKNGIKTKGYDNTRDLVNSLGSNDIAALDDYSYDYYIRFGLRSFKRIRTLDMGSDYNFALRNIGDNEIFNDLFSFYLTFVNKDSLISESYRNLLNYDSSNNTLRVVLSSLAIVLMALVGFMTYKILRRGKKYNGKLSKLDKLRYTDNLTSLKNRNYLNENIPRWDSSEVYPQAIVIVDLNNVAYINDNFGYPEGDKVIVEASGILIKTQLSNSELIRTNGNEFLIFMVGHDEKAVITYIRKLNREFKDLSHGFGAAIGYSMITDEIKTIDDAINEATSDMKNNKEEIIK